MKIAYLILAHREPLHLSRLISRLTAGLSSSEVHCYIHLDKKADLAPFERIKNQNVTFCAERKDCTWGHISIVDATLLLLKTAMNSSQQPDYFILLSGQCYPLRTAVDIASFLKSHRDAEFIETYSFPNVEYGKPPARLGSYWIRKSAPFLGFRWRIQRLLHFAIRNRDFKSALAGMQPIVGSQWWALSALAVRHIDHYIQANPEFYNFCRHTDCPDEFVFQTIVGNSRFRDKISHSLTYTHWSPGETGPDSISCSHLPDLMLRPVLDSRQNNCPNEKKEVLFARKFSDSSLEIVKAIDQLADRSVEQTPTILQSENTHG